MLIIRPETSRDTAAIRAVIESAFAGTSEADLVDLLRRDAKPFVSLVAEEEGRIVGHICFSPVTIENTESPGAIGLAPLAVVPDLQNRGIGSQLVRAGLEECRRQRHTLVVVLGHPDYYPRFGFVPAHTVGLSCEYDVPANHFMALCLDGTIDRIGLVRYHPAFGLV